MGAHQLRTLNDAGRAMSWKEYQRFGYAISHIEVWHLSRSFGPIARWPDHLTLGEIEDACPAAGRLIARVFADHVNRRDLTVPLESEFHVNGYRVNRKAN